MTKYRLKIDIGNNKAGTIIEQTSFGTEHPEWHLFQTNNRGLGYTYGFCFYRCEIPMLLEQGIIEEIQEPKFTEQDMMEFKNFPAQRTMSMRELLSAFCKEKGIEL